jgi:plastocyanin
VLVLLGVARRHEAPAARAAATWEVRTAEPAEGGQYGFNAFFPNPLTIHAGDSVRWILEGGHTITFLGARANQAPPPQFVPGGPFPDGRVAGPGFFPIGPEGPYDGVDVRSSGRLGTRDEETYVLTFTTPGIYPYVCLTHPGMNGTITAVAGNDDLAETPAHAQARGQAEREALLANIRAGVEAVRLASAPAATGTRAHAVAAGVTNGSGGSALQFVPAELSVRRGDLVAWLVPDPPEPHTVTFTSGAPASDFVEVVQQPGGAPLFAQRPEVFRPVGGTTYTGQGYLSSGQLLGGARGPIAFVAQIDAPAGTYEYQCLIHTEMKARIVVTE